MKKIIPKYAWIILVITFSMNTYIYIGIQRITENFYHHDISTSLDHAVPFLTVFIIPYVLAYVQWVVGYVMIARESKDYCYRVLGGVILAKLMAGVIFLLFPTTMQRPELAANDVFSRLVGVIYDLDAPTNLFPSLHCMESWMCFRGSLRMKSVPNIYKTGMLILTIFVFLSTIFIKQHCIIDIAGGMLVAEVGLFLGERLFRKRG